MATDAVVGGDADDQRLLRSIGLRIELRDAEMQRLDAGDLQRSPLRCRSRRCSKRRL
jgi:hypothetical protein